MNERILRAVAKRHDLEGEELDELRQLAERNDGLDQLVAHGERIAHRRRFVKSWTHEHPSSTEAEAATRFERMTPITTAPAGGRKFLASLLAQSTDPKTAKFLGSISGRTRHSDESKADRRERIHDRLRAAGFSVQDNTYGHGDEERQL